jgi:SAM-dependent methyltransferase
VRRVLRPAIWPVRDDLQRLHKRLDDVARAVNADDATMLVWRGGLRGHLVWPDGSRPPVPAAPDVAATAHRYHGEIRYWSNVARGLDKHYPGTWPEPTMHWQRGRFMELAKVLGFAGWEPFTQWSSGQRAVEVGGGPCPALTVAPWKSAVAVDPLAEAYVAEGLLPAQAAHVAHVVGVGESMPIAGGSADLVICENCLDHVSRPGKVVEELARIVRPGGLVWLLVDLMDQPDPVHPHPMSEQKLRALMGSAGLRARFWEVRAHHSHPRAHGELRALLERPALADQAAEASSNGVVVVPSREATKV